MIVCVVLYQFHSLEVIRLVRDELRLAWKVDEIRRQKQGVVTKSCGQVGQFPAAFTEFTGSHRKSYILLDPICRLLVVFRPRSDLFIFVCKSMWI